MHRTGASVRTLTHPTDILVSMSNYRRYFVPGGAFFFTVVSHERRGFLTQPLARRCLREAFETARAKRPFEIVAIVLLPDHLHSIRTLPNGDPAYSVGW